jgi:transposase InsO family protein
MPWPILNVNTIRREFVTKALLRGASFAALCREYGVSRKTGYKWQQRALADGLSRLAEHSRRPKSSPGQLDEPTVCTLIRFKLRHPNWGPKKIRQLYARQFQPVPSLSSCQRVLTKAGLVLRRRRRTRPTAQRLAIGAVARAPNEVWTVDFKGWWRTGDGQRCEPLTVRDAFSRYVLTARTLPQANSAGVRAEFERLFQLYGLPQVIKSDNGAPFATASAPLGLSRLSAWWVALDIELDRSRPAHPQDNGAHERLHRDIAVELSRCVQPDLSAQQAALDLWREEFNQDRPHEALGGRCPGELYQPSARQLPEGPVHLDYGPGLFPRKINPNGTLKWQNQVFLVSTAIAGWHVGLRPVTPDLLEVWFNHLLLGQLELSTASFLRAASRPQEAVNLTA